MLLGLLPALHQALHSRLLLSLSFHTNSRAAANGTMVRLTLEYPSQSCTEIQPASLYITCGQHGTLEGRCSDLRQALHSCLLLNLHLRTVVRAASKERKVRMRCPPGHFAKLASVPPSKAPRSAVGCVPWACHLTAAAPSRTPVLVPRASSRASGVRSSFSTSVSEQVRSVAWCMGSSHRGDRDWEVMVHEARGEPRPVSNRPRAGEVNGFASIIPVYCALGRSVAWSAWT